VRSVEEAGIEVVFASSLVRDAILLVKAIRKASFRPKAIIASSAGFGLYTLLEAGEDVEGIFTTNAPAYVDLRSLNDVGRDLSHEFRMRLKASTGREPTGFSAMAFVATYSLLNDVLPKAEEINEPESVREAALAADLPLGTYPNGWGLKFNEVGQNVRAIASVDQWQGGSLVTVAPVNLASAAWRFTGVSRPDETVA
jgi:branched-chain amino acid transport system substrate-binding protein